MTTTTDETSVPQVGERLERHDLPIGSIIRGNVSARVWEKDANGWNNIENPHGSCVGPRATRQGNYTIVRIGPEVTPTPDTTPITSVEQFRDLPVGAVIGRPVNQTRWTKQVDDRYRSGAGTVRSLAYFSLDGTYHIISTPEFEAVEETSSESEHPYPVGHPLQSYAEINRLPVGTVIGPFPEETYIKVREGTVDEEVWEHNGHPQNFFVQHGHNQVLSYPDTVETQDEAPRSVTVDGRTFTVGQEVEQNTDFALLPVGTELLEDGRIPYRKTGDREFTNTRGGGTIGITNFGAYQHHVITALPEPASPYHVGLVIDSRELMVGLPEGTVLKVSQRHRRLGNDDARWVVGGDGTYRNRQTGHVGRLTGCRTDSFMQIESLPGAFTVNQALLQADYPNLPEGTEVQHSTGGIYRKVGDHMENVATLGTVLEYNLFGDNSYRIVSLPNASGSDSEPVSGPFPIGHWLASVEEVSSLPPGTQVGNRSGVAQFFMRSDGLLGTINYEHNPAYIHQPSAFTGGYYVASYPEPVPYTVGQRMDQDTWLAVPIGSVVHQDSPQYAYRKDGPSVWTGVGLYSSGSHWCRDLGNHCTLAWVPDEYPRHRQTLVEYQQMFRTIVYGSQQANGVDAGPVDAAMEALGIGQPTIAIGLVVDVYDEVLLGRLPDGTVLKGGDPKHHASFGVFVKQRDTWVHILGGANRFEGVLTVVTIPGHNGQASWMTRNGTDQDQADIEEFKARAADLGTKAKRSNSWCGAYEGAMHRAGIDQPLTD